MRNIVTGSEAERKARRNEFYPSTAGNDTAEDPATHEPQRVGITATKANREGAVGIGFRKEVRHCSERIYISRVADESIFANSDLAVGDEVLSIDVPVSAMSAAEVTQLVQDSEGQVTVMADRSRKAASSSFGGGEEFTSRSARLLSSQTDFDCVAAVAKKRYRTTEAGLGFRTSVGEDGRGRVLVADVEADSIFADTDLRVGDEVVSVEVSVEGRTASEIADIMRASEGDITLFVVDRMRRVPAPRTSDNVPNPSPSTREKEGYKFGDITRGIVARGKRKDGRDESSKYQFGDFTRGLLR